MFILLEMELLQKYGAVMTIYFSLMNLMVINHANQTHVQVLIGPMLTLVQAEVTFLR